MGNRKATVKINRTYQLHLPGGYILDGCTLKTVEGLNIYKGVIRCFTIDPDLHEGDATLITIAGASGFEAFFDVLFDLDRGKDGEPVIAGTAGLMEVIRKAVGR